MIELKKKLKFLSCQLIIFLRTLNLHQKVCLPLNLIEPVLCLETNNDVAAILKRTVNSRLVSIHCICHRLALACTDTLGDVSYIKQVQLWLLQLWKLFENSPKKSAVYLKTQMQLKSVTLSNEKKP